MTYYIISALCILALLAILVYTIVRIFRKKGAERTKAIRDFKKGQCAIVYIPAIPLYWLGFVFSGEQIFPSFFNSVNKVFSLVVLRYDTGDIEPLMNENIVYAIAVYFCFILVAANAMLFTISFLYQKVWMWFKNRSWGKAHSTKILIIGHNKENVKIYDSEKNASKMILDDIADKDSAELFFRKTVHKSTKDVSKDVKERLDDFFENLKISLGDNTKNSENKPEEETQAKVEDKAKEKKTSKKTTVEEGSVETPEEKAKKESAEKLMIIINTQDDEKNIRYCQDIILWLKNHFELNILKKSEETLEEREKSANEDEDTKKAKKEEEKEKEKENREKFILYYSRIQIYVFGNPIHEDIYNSLVESSFGALRYVNKYRQIAVDFINKYPLTEFMNENQIDVETSTIKKGVDLNVLMIGFGKANKQIFLTSVANNQFLCDTSTYLDKPLRKSIVSKLVNYHIFDYDNANNNKNLNHSYYRYGNEIKKSWVKDCLPLPPKPSRDKYYNLDINDGKFYSAVKSIISSGNNDINYIIISFGTDLENIDLAQKLLQKKNEWNVRNCYVFVKVRSGNSDHSIFARNDCYLIGNENECVYNVKAIDDNRITEMAKMRNRSYALEYSLRNEHDKDYSEDTIREIYTNADYDWYVKKTQFERESNIYACLSLRSKLHMMGLDYVEKINEEPVGEKKKKKDKKDKKKDNNEQNEKSTEASKIIHLNKDEYEARYARDDEIKPLEVVSVDGRRIVEYGMEYQDSRRKTLAIQEHYRWNSFMISKGFIPATVNEIEIGEKNGKDYMLRKHGNLTTFDGLIKFRKTVAKAKGCTEASADVIQYDYQLMDDAYWLLEKNAFSICEKFDKSKKVDKKDEKAEKSDVKKKDKNNKKASKK